MRLNQHLLWLPLNLTTDEMFAERVKTNRRFQLRRVVSGVAVCLQREARVPAVPLRHGAHAGAGSRPAGQRHAQRAAGALCFPLRRQRAAGHEQTLPPPHRRLCGRLPLAG